MRLYDTVMAQPGTITDHAYRGAYSFICPIMRRAQCFELNDNVVDICNNLCLTKPTTMLSALPMMRMPYPSMWLEWTPSDYRDHKKSNNGKPIPKKMGCYIESEPDGTKGVVIFFWQHNEYQSVITELSVNPLGIVFDWSDTLEKSPRAQFGELFGITDSEYQPEVKRTDIIEAHRAAMVNGEKWRRFANDDREVEAFVTLQERSDIVPLLQFQGIFEAAGPDLYPGSRMYESFVNDIAGEFPFVESFILMLNTKNSIIESRREDLSRLNKARVKSRKRPLREFTTTHIRLSRAQAHRAGGSNPAQADVRAHLVRAHFKVRSSGVYWWSSFMRGKGAPVQRAAYQVR